MTGGGWPRPGAGQEDKRRELTVAYANRKWITKLAPIVELLADWLDRRAGAPDHDPILRAPPVRAGVASSR